MVLQVITVPDERYETYRKSCDWIRRHIFPGGHLPSLAAISKAVENASGLRITETTDIGLHYVRTLRDWRKRFLANRDRVEALGFDERFQRKWLYYLCYCEAGFSTRSIHDLQLVLTRPEAG
jgi:cyclopropane-fatty-acyl-phospholipid synthase